MFFVDSASSPPGEVVRATSTTCASPPNIPTVAHMHPMLRVVWDTRCVRPEWRNTLPDSGWCWAWAGRREEEKEEALALLSVYVHIHIPRFTRL